MNDLLKSITADLLFSLVTELALKQKTEGIFHNSATQMLFLLLMAYY